MPYTSPATQSAGAVATAAYANSLKAALDFLANPPACRVSKAAVQNIANGAVTNLLCDTELFDTDGMHSTTVNTDRITVNTAGLYIVGVWANFATDTDYDRVELGLRLNGATVIAANDDSGSDTTTDLNLICETLYKFTAGQYVNAFAYQANASGGTSNITVNGVWAVWVGLG